MEEGGPAIRALGHLFKLTEVHLWDGAASEVGGGSLSQLDKPPCIETVGSNEESTFDEVRAIPEDLELSRQMDEMGLPLSFRTNKEKRARTTRGQRKDSKKTNHFLQKDVSDDMLEVTTLSGGCHIDNSLLWPRQSGLPGSENTDEVSQLSNGVDASAASSVEVTDLRKNCEKLELTTLSSGWMSSVDCISDIDNSLLWPCQSGLPGADIAVNTDEVSQLSNGVDASTASSVEVTDLRKNCDKLELATLSGGWMSSVDCIRDIYNSLLWPCQTELPGADIAGNTDKIGQLSNGVDASTASSVDVTDLRKNCEKLELTTLSSGWMSSVDCISDIDNSLLWPCQSGLPGADIAGNTDEVSQLSNGVDASTASSVEVTDLRKNCDKLELTTLSGGWMSSVDCISDRDNSLLWPCQTELPGADIAGNTDKIGQLSNGVDASTASSVEVTDLRKNCERLELTTLSSGWMSSVDCISDIDNSLLWPCQSGLPGSDITGNTDEVSQLSNGVDASTASSVEVTDLRKNCEKLELTTLSDGWMSSVDCISDIDNSLLWPCQSGLPGADTAGNTDEVSQLSNGVDASTASSVEVTDLRKNCDLVCDSICLFDRGTVNNLSSKLDEGSSSESTIVEAGNSPGKAEAYQNLGDDTVAFVDAETEIVHNDVSADRASASEDTVCSQCTETVDYTVGGKHDALLGDWRTCWDDYYMRTYFYNIVTLDSTWDPPPGVTDLEIPTAFDGSNEVTLEIEQSKASFADSGELVESGISCVLQPSVDMSEESFYDVGSSNEPYNNPGEQSLFAESCSEVVNIKKKNRTKKLKSKGILPVPNEDSQIRGNFEEMCPSLDKYWFQRYLLFSRYDEGIQMDEEGWFSVTPEAIAAHHALRCEGGTVIDCFAGVGGNAIQFAKKSLHVVAIDIDPRKIDYARHNAAIYGVEDNIDFVRGDCFLLASQLKADIVFLSPPWGGPDYSKVKVFDMMIMLQPHDGHFLFNIAKKIAPEVVMFLPRNVDLNQLAEIAMSANPPWSLEIEKNFLNGKLKAITAYFSESVSEKE